MENCTYIPVEFIALAEVMVDLVEENSRGFKFNIVSVRKISRHHL